MEPGAPASQGPVLLTGKAVLVTGAARRIGAAVARTLHGAGACVMIHYRSSAHEAEALAQELNATRPRSARTVQADLLDIARLPVLVEATVGAFGRLDILVNNASSFYPTPMGKMTEEAWDDLMGSNLKAPLFLSQAAAEPLRASRGLILNFADIHGTRPLRHHTIYCMAKAGMIMLTRSLARELAPEVRVNAIAPGPVMWPEDGMGDEMKENIVGRTLLKRSGSPEDVARAALFFATDAPYVTGQMLAIDGGRSVVW